MAQRDPYAVPRRGGDAAGPLIRWTVILALGAASAAFAYQFMTAEPSGPSDIQAQEKSAPQYAATAPQTVTDATDVDAPPLERADAKAAAPSEPGAAPARAARPRPRRAPPPAEPENEPPPPPAAGFPVTPAMPPIDNPQAQPVVPPPPPM